MEELEKETFGWVAGFGSGAFAGARIGSLVPIPVVGTIAGALVGAMVGSELGRSVGKASINGASAFVDTFRTPAPNAFSDAQMSYATVPA